MTLLNYLKRDIKNGIIYRSYLFLILFLFVSIMAYECSSVVEYLRNENYMGANGTIMDYYIYSMKGVISIDFNPLQSFELPLLWFTFQMGVSYFIAYYAENDFVNNGTNVISAGKSRTLWWLSKMLWCIISVFCYFVTTFILCSVFALIHGAEFSFDISRDYLSNYFGYSTSFMSYRDFIVVTIVVPILVTMGICLLQMLLSFVVSSVTSFAMSCAVYVLSAYKTAWFLPGSFTIWVRSSYYVEGGLNPLSGVMLSLVIIVSVFILGDTMLKNKDIL